jgi:hypothetical protein
MMDDLYFFLLSSLLASDCNDTIPLALVHLLFFLTSLFHHA